MPHFQSLWACKSWGRSGWKQQKTPKVGVFYCICIYTAYEFVTGCSSTWHKLSIYKYYINMDRDSIIPGGSKVRKLSFQVTKSYNHTLSQLGLVSQARGLDWFTGLEHALISQASMTVANWDPVLLALLIESWRLKGSSGIVSWLARLDSQTACKTWHFFEWMQTCWGVLEFLFAKIAHSTQTFSHIIGAHMIEVAIHHFAPTS